jgi:phosphinothricin acetyltransferase
MIRAATLNDAPAICEIYNHYVLHTIITFEEIPVQHDEMEKRISIISASYPWLLYEENGQVLAYAYACKWKERSAYRFTTESGIYVRNDSFGKGIGNLLYSALLKQLSDMKFHSVLGGIALPNERSIALHEKLGFQKVGQLRQVGFKLGQWIDVGYWEKLLLD